MLQISGKIVPVAIEVCEVVSSTLNRWVEGLNPTVSMLPFRLFVVSKM